MRKKVSRFTYINTCILQLFHDTMFAGGKYYG